MQAPLEFGCFQARCGDGRVDANENCDDGNTSDDGWCSSDCQVETAICGDGHVSPAEVCDDGEDNRESYDLSQACHSTCLGYVPHCGDGIINIDDGELCDDGNRIDNDGCNETCTGP